MADPTTQNTPETADPVVVPVANEDAETTAARRELKHTSISEQGAVVAQDSGSDNGTPAAGSRKATPEPAIAEDKDTEMKEQVSSPKKKRARDELDETKDANDAESGDKASAEESKSTATQSRTDRSEPEKKRARDETSLSEDGAKETTATSAPAETTTTETTIKPAEPAAESKPATEDKPQTSSSAFAQSGFAKLASSTTSPFGALGGSGAPNLFGSTNSGSASPFGTLGAATAAAAPTAPKLSFASSAAAPSPFAGFNSASTGGSVFGGGFSSGFGGSALGGAKLTSFGGKPGETLTSSKPAKPFGAPDSDAEDSEEEGDNEKEDAGSNEEKEGDNDEAKSAAEEEKKLKLRKVVVDDGEGEDATLLAVRAKIFVMEKGVGWKERGAGMLKVNVPKASVKRDHSGNWNSRSFDASALVEDNGDGESGGSGGRKSVRLVMRQDHTLRVILNTAIVPAMDFVVTKKLKAAYVLFTAFEGTEPRQVQVKLSDANATAFKDLMDLIQKQLGKE